MIKKHQSDAIRTYDRVAPPRPSGLGPGSAGQSGDTQGLPGGAEADSESVLELAEEGQYYEASFVAGVEDAENSEVKEVEVARAKDLPAKKAKKHKK